MPSGQFCLRTQILMEFVLFRLWKPKIIPSMLFRCHADDNHRENINHKRNILVPSWEEQLHLDWPAGPTNPPLKRGKAFILYSEIELVKILGQLVREWISKFEYFQATHTALYLSQFLASLARRNQHKFPSRAAEEANMIYNYDVFFTGEATSKLQPIHYYMSFKSFLRYCYLFACSCRAGRRGQ